MKLYHFTHDGVLAAILTEGLTKGDVPLSPTQGENAVWFTTDPTPSGHGVPAGSKPVVVTEQLAKLSGLPLGATYESADKQKIRIMVGFQTSRTPGLVKWLDYAKKRKIDRKWLACLHAAAGANPKSHTWWLWLATMPPAFFGAVDVRTPDGSYVPLAERPDVLGADVREEILIAYRALAEAKMAQA